MFGFYRLGICLFSEIWITVYRIYSVHTDLIHIFKYFVVDMYILYIILIIQALMGKPTGCCFDSWNSSCCSFGTMGVYEFDPYPPKTIPVQMDKNPENSIFYVSFLFLVKDFSICLSFPCLKHDAQSLALCEDVLISTIGGGFKYFRIFTPSWRDDPIWLAHIFQMGWLNHQQDKYCTWHSIFLPHAWNLQVFGWMAST